MHRCGLAKGGSCNQEKYEDENGGRRRRRLSQLAPRVFLVLVFLAWCFSWFNNPVFQV